MPFYTDYQNTRFRGYSLYRTAPLVLLSIILNLAIFHHYFRSSIGYQILLLVFKSLNNLAPSYISDLLTPYILSRSLRSSNQSLLVVPRSIQKSYGDRAFAVAAPRLWIALPIHMKQPGFSLAAFKKCLETYLFKNASFSNILRFHVIFVLIIFYCF